MTTQSEQQRIDERGKALLKKLLVGNFIVREQSPDYGIDYTVERVLDTEVTGRVVSVQLKSTAGCKVNRNSTVSVRLKTKNLRDYFDTVRQPLFVIAADVERERAYWLDLEVVRGKLRKGWRDQRTVTIQVPTANDVSDQTNFIAGFEFAMQRHPAILANVEAKAIESIDPRFRMTRSEVTLPDGKVMRHIRPVAAVDLQVTFLNREIIERVLAGQRVIVPSGEVKLGGTPLFEEPFSEFHFAAYRGVQGEIRIRTTQGARIDPVVLCGEIRFGLGNEAFCGEFGLGGSELVTVCIPNGPLAIGTGPRPVTFQLNLDSWIGVPLLQLPWFSEIFALCQTLDSREPFTAEFWARGHHFLSVFNGPINSPEVNAALGLLTLIEGLQPHFAKAGLQPTYQRPNGDTGRWLEMLSALLADPDNTTANLGGTFAITFRNVGSPGSGVDSEGTIDEVGVIGVPLFDVLLPIVFRIVARAVVVRREGLLVSLSSTSESILRLSLPPEGVQE